MSYLNEPSDFIAAPEDIEQILEKSAQIPSTAVMTNSDGYDTEFAWGMLDAGAAMDSVDSSFFKLIHINTPLSLSINTEKTDSLISITEKFGYYFGKGASNTNLFRRDGTYKADVFKVTAQYIHSLPQGYHLRDAWPRHSSSTGAMINGENEGAWKVRLDSFDDSTATLTGFFYLFKEDPRGSINHEWYPFNPNSPSFPSPEIKFGYTLYLEKNGTTSNETKIKEEPISIKIIPNPSIGSATLIAGLQEKGKALVNIYNLNGQLVYHKDLGIQMASNVRFELPTQLVGSGLYLVQLINESKTHTIRWIIE